MYTGFADVYDNLMQDVPYDAWAAHYKDLLTQCGVPAHGSVCECACGTGALTLRMQKMGYHMTGVDLSGEMLAHAMEKARAGGLLIPFIKRDMCALSLHKPADAILCTCDGLNYLLTPQRVKAFFSSANAALKTGGALVFDLSTPEKLSQTLGNHLLGQMDDDISYLWLNEYDEKKHQVAMQLSFFVKREDGTYQRIDEEQTQRAHQKEEIEQWLCETGFDVTGFYGEMRDTPPRDGDMRWHVAARKK